VRAQPPRSPPLSPLSLCRGQQQQQQQQQQQHAQLLQAPLLTPRTAALAAERGSSDDGFSFNAGYAVAWVSLISFAAFLGPGTLNSPSDSALLADLLASPQGSPSVTPVFNAVWALFAIAPLNLAALLLPSRAAIASSSKEKRGLPLGLPLALSAFIGYFALGPYMILRPTVPDDCAVVVTEEELGFVGRAFEGKVLAGAILLAGLSVPFTSGLAGALLAGGEGGGEEVARGFWELVKGSKFASVACVDLAALSLTPVVSSSSSPAAAAAVLRAAAASAARAAPAPRSPLVLAAVLAAVLAPLVLSLPARRRRGAAVLHRACEPAEGSPQCACERI